MQDYELDNGVKVTNIHYTSNCPKGISVPIWLELCQWLKKYIILVKKLHILKFSCDLEIRSRSPKSNQFLTLVTMIYQCKFEENPSTG